MKMRYSTRLAHDTRIAHGTHVRWASRPSSCRFNSRETLPRRPAISAALRDTLLPIPPFQAPYNHRPPAPLPPLPTIPPFQAPCADELEPHKQRRHTPDPRITVSPRHP